VRSAQIICICVLLAACESTGSGRGMPEVGVPVPADGGLGPAAPLGGDASPRCVTPQGSVPSSSSRSDRANTSGADGGGGCSTSAEKPAAEEAPPQSSDAGETIPRDAHENFPSDAYGTPDYGAPVDSPNNAKTGALVGKNGEQSGGDSAMQAPDTIAPEPVGSGGNSSLYSDNMPEENRKAAPSDGTNKEPLTEENGATDSATRGEKELDIEGRLATPQSGLPNSTEAGDSAASSPSNVFIPDGSQTTGSSATFHTEELMEEGDDASSSNNSIISGDVQRSTSTHKRYYLRNRPKEKED